MQVTSHFHASPISLDPSKIAGNLAFSAFSFLAQPLTNLQVNLHYAFSCFSYFSQTLTNLQVIWTSFASPSSPILSQTILDSLAVSHSPCLAKPSYKLLYNYFPRLYLSSFCILSNKIISCSKIHEPIHTNKQTYYVLAI